MQLVMWFLFGRVQVTSNASTCLFNAEQIPIKNQGNTLMQDYVEDLLDIQYDEVDDDSYEDYSDI